MSTVIQLSHLTIRVGLVVDAQNLAATVRNNTSIQECRRLAQEKGFFYVGFDKRKVLDVAAWRPFPVNHYMRFGVSTENNIMPVSATLISGYPAALSPDDRVKLENELRQLQIYADQQRHFNVRLHPIRQNGTKCSDADIALQMMRLAHTSAVDIIHLFSGDEDFVPIINEAKSLGKIVVVSGFNQNTSPEVINAASEYIPLNGIFG